MTVLEMIILGISIALLAWIAFALSFLRHRLSTSRRLRAIGLMVGPAIYAAVLAALLGKGAAFDPVWMSLALALGGAMAALRSRGTRLSFDQTAGAWFASTSPLALVTIATIALVQPVGLIARQAFGRAFDEPSYHVSVVVFLLSLSSIYALLIAGRMRLCAPARPV